MVLMTKIWVEVERSFKEFMKKKGFCVKLILKRNGDAWVELQEGGINIGITRIFSKPVAYLNFYDNGVYCKLIQGAPIEQIRASCRDFSEARKLGVIVSSTFLPDHYEQKTETMINRMLKNGYQEREIVLGSIK